MTEWLTSSFTEIDRSSTESLLGPITWNYLPCISASFPGPLHSFLTLRLPLAMRESGDPVNGFLEEVLCKCAIWINELAYWLINHWLVFSSIDLLRMSHWLCTMSIDCPMNDIWIHVFSGISKVEKRPRELVVQEQLLHYLESAYPNVLPTDDLAELVKSDSDGCLLLFIKCWYLLYTYYLLFADYQQWVLHFKCVDLLITFEMV